MKTIFTPILLLFSIVCFSQNQQSVMPLDLSFKQFLNCRDFTMSADGNEGYFTVQNLNENKSIIVKTLRKGKKWGSFEIVKFSGVYRDIEPFLSPNNLKLYFSSNRPNQGDKTNDYDIWYVERKNTNSKWSEPKNIGAPVNTDFNEFYPSLSTNNNIYYTSDQYTKTSKDDILFAKWNSKNYNIPQRFEENINSKGYEFNSYISPQEEFLLYSIYRAKDGLGSGDLYISFKNESGQFEKRKNLGKTVNSKFMDYCPYYDQKNKILYFTSKRDEIPQSEVNTLKDFTQMIENYANGQSRIYKIKINLNELK